MSSTGSSNEYLRRVLNFTEIDLAANRKGRLTNSQQLHLIKRTAGFFLAISVVMTIFFFVNGGVRLLWQMLGYYAVLFLVMLPWLGYVSRGVKSVEGKLSKYEKATGDPREPAIRYLRVKGLDFSVSDDIYDCFLNGLNYRIFYTSIGKLIVAAERVDWRAQSSGESSPIQDSDRFNVRLREALEFTEADLAANRTGQITPGQAKHIIMNSPAMNLLKVTIPMVVVGGIGTVSFIGRGNMIQMISLIFLIIGGLQLTAVLVRMPWSDMLQRTAYMVEGPVTKEKTRDGAPLGGVLLILKVQGIKLAVPDYVYDCFENGRSYRIFYTRFSKKAVAAEYAEQQYT